MRAQTTNPGPARSAHLVLAASLAPVLVGGAAVVACPAAAHGHGGPVERSTVVDSFDSGAEEPDPFWVEQCGVEVRQTAMLSVRRTVFADGRTVLHLVEESDWTDFATGELLLLQRDREVLTDALVSETVDEQEGTRTLVLDVDYVGVPLKLRTPGGGVVAIDAGRLERTITLVLDLETGDLVREDVRLDRVAGQWSFLGLLAPGAGPGFQELVEVVCEHLDRGADAT